MRAYEEMQRYGAQIAVTNKEVFRSFTDTVNRIDDFELGDQTVKVIKREIRVSVGGLGQ
jgi:hypothetical protein